MASRKADTEGIDENLLLEAIGRRKQDGSIKPLSQVMPVVPSATPEEEHQAEQAVPTETPKESPSRRKRQSADYASNATRSKPASVSISAVKSITRFPR